MTTGASGPRPLPRRESWRETLLVAGFVAGVFLVILTITLVAQDGPGAFLSSLYWVMAAFLAAVALLIGIAIRYGTVTQDQVRHRADAIRARRSGRPRDRVRLAAATGVERRGWRRRAHRLLRTRIAVELLLALPFAALLGHLVGDELAPLPGSVVHVWALAAALVVLVPLAIRIRRQLGDPLLLVARVTAGVDGIAMGFGRKPTLKGQLLRWFEYGHARTIRIEVDAASSLAADGTLRARPDWHGAHEVGVSRRALRHLIEGEQCVLLCSGAGTVVDRLGDFA